MLFNQKINIMDSVKVVSEFLGKEVTSDYAKDYLFHNLEKVNKFLEEKTKAQEAKQEELENVEMALINQLEKDFDKNEHKYISSFLMDIILNDSNKVAIIDYLDQEMMDKYGL